MHRAHLNNFICAALLIGALTTNRDSAGGSRESSAPSHIIGGKDDQMMTEQIPTLVPPGLRLRDLVAGDSFAMHISGNSMEPDYHDGDRVVFSVVAVRQAERALGFDCMFWRKDGKATFKRLKEMRDGTLMLHALNQKAFPDPLSMEAAELQLLAIARYIYREASSAHSVNKSGTPETSNAAQPASKSSKRKAPAGFVCEVHHEDAANHRQASG